MIWWIIFLIVILILVALSGLFSFSEMAISSANKTRLLTIIDSKEYGERKKRKAKKVIHFIDNYNEHITAIVIFNNIVNILFSTLATVFFTLIAETYLHNAGYGALLSFVITTPVVIIFGEIVPKQLAKKYPEKGTMALSAVISIVNVIMKPITFILSKIIKEEDNTAFISDEEINTALQQTTEAGVTTAFEQALIKRLLSADELSVSDIMIPLKDVVTIKEGITKTQINSLLKDTSHTRFPVVNEDNEVISIFSTKRYLLDKLRNKLEDFKEYTYTFATFNLDENPFNILETLRSRREKMCVIVDENHKFVGIITLEDVVELIVGEIYDEHDIEEDGVYSLNESSYILNKGVKMGYWVKEYSINVRISNDIKAMTIDQWVRELKGSKPSHGDSFTYKNLIIWVRKDKYNSKQVVYEIDII